MKNLIFTIISIISFYSLSFSQIITQTVSGKVIDKTTHEPIVGANIVLLNSKPIIGTSTNIDGEFILSNVPVGRQGIEVSMIGCENYIENEILISSGKQTVLNVALQESIIRLDEIVIKPKRDKEKPINSMATVSGRQFTVEETQRYAGGLNDPARLVSSFAGVASPSISSNGISVRGNSPSGLLWRIEGVEVPSPNHFANLTISGAGLLTVLSSQMMDNSDFYTGAFPSEYGNATSGVFDINLRTGNSSKREYTIQTGLIGVDFATEGPLKQGKKASYLFNYRYSTMALISPVLPSNSGILKYQDLSYKINIPTKKAGTYSLWSLAAYDGINIDALDSVEWKSRADRDNSQTSLYMFATGINHKIRIKSKAFLETSLSMTGNGLTHKEQRLDDNLQPHPQSNAYKNDYKYTLQSSITHYFSNKHTNRTGFYINHLGYELDIEQSNTTGALPITLIKEKGQTNLFQFYSQSKIRFLPKFTLNVGFHSLYFWLNNRFSFEPRLSLKYKINCNQDIAFAYGLHSRIEPLPIYFSNKTGSYPNKDLELMKSAHYVLSYNLMINENLKLSIEPYYQHLYNIPVSPDSYISTINTQNNLFFNEQLISKGTGKNIGIDFTLERYLNKGFYFLFTGSIFNSTYKAADGIVRNTRFNKNYVFNALIGKECQIGKDKNNLLSTNVRLNYLGGNRVETLDIQSSLNTQSIIYAETSGNLAFSKKTPDTPILSFTISYRRNQPKYSSVWTLQVLNVSATNEYDKDFYNIETNTIDTRYNKILIPNLSYKIEF